MHFVITSQTHGETPDAKFEKSFYLSAPAPADFYSLNVSL